MFYVADWIYFIIVGKGNYVILEERRRRDAKLLIINISDVWWWIMVVLNYIKSQKQNIQSHYTHVCNQLIFIIMVPALFHHHT